MDKSVIAIISQKTPSDQLAYLLIKATKDFGEYTGFYYPPGGHLDNNETYQQALRRELKEELNLDVIPIKKIATTNGDVSNLVVEWWETEIVDGDLKLQTDEIEDARFFTQDEMKSIPIWPATKKFFEEYIFNK